MGPDDAGRPAPSGGGVRPSFGELASNALRYWEPRRALSGSRATGTLAVVGAGRGHGVRGRARALLHARHHGV